MPLKIGYHDSGDIGEGGGYYPSGTWVADAIDYAAELIGEPGNQKPRAQIINMSFSLESSLHWPVVKSKIDTAIANGCIVIVAADNTGSPIDNVWPANYEPVITVAATNDQDKKWGGVGSGSNYGENVDVSAPGENIYVAGFTGLGTTRNENYQTAKGTSFAAPMVAGEAALLLAKEPNLSVADLKVRIKEKVYPFFDQDDKYIGTGIINVGWALDPNGDSEEPIVSNKKPGRYDSAGPNYNICFEIDDGLSGVKRETLNVTIEHKTAIDDGDIQTSDFSGSIIPDGTGGYNVTINPDEVYRDGDIIHIVIKAEDHAGNPIEKSYYFRVSNLFPYVRGRFPSNDTTNVPINTGIYFEVMDAAGIDPGINLDTLQVTITCNDNDPGNDNAIVGEVFQTSYSGSIIPNDYGGYNISIKPEVNFSQGDTVVVKIEVSDNDNLSISPPDTFSFTTGLLEDTTPPVGANPEPVGPQFADPDTNILVHITDDLSGVDKNTIISMSSSFGKDR